MIFFGLYYLVKRAIYLSSKKIFNGNTANNGTPKVDVKPKKSKKIKRTMKGRAEFFLLFISISIVIINRATQTLFKRFE